MKKSFLLLLFIAFAGIVLSQTVENIQVEQNGEKLNINYRIGGSTSEQLYFVTLTCSIDGGPVFEPKSVIGDVGANIRGGKSYNTIVWSVFNDVEEVGDVEFFIKVDLKKGDSKAEIKSTPVNPQRVNPSVKAKSSAQSKIGLSEYRKFHIAYSGGSAHYAGINIGYLRNWGAYGSFRYGGYNFYYFDGFLYEGTLMSLDAGITKRILSGKNGRLYAYLGGGAGDLDLNWPELDFGATYVIKNRFTVSLGISTGWPDLTFGAGLVL